MSQDSVLQPIIEARQKIGERAKHLTDAQGLLDTLIRESSEEYESVENAFNDLMKHVQNEGARALGVANDVAARIAVVTSHAQKYDQDQATLFTEIGTNAAMLTQSSRNGKQIIIDTENHLTGLDSAVQDMLTRVGKAADDGKNSLSENFEQLTNANAQWRIRLDQSTQDEREAINADCVVMCETEFGNWQQQLQTDIQNAQSQIDALRTRLESEVTNDVINFGKAHDKVQALLTKTFGTLEKTLKDLEGLVERVGNTLDESTETMNDLLSATNVGLEAVIGLIDTISQLCEEIADLWF